ncbi:Calcium-dependent protein kinase 4 [Quaeritorhiza haematococci]|nr:Calcium-dependent protein kinase 4 [Quaeritorhiza haematococci]
MPGLDYEPIITDEHIEDSWRRMQLDFVRRDGESKTAFWRHQFNVRDRENQDLRVRLAEAEAKLAERDARITRLTADRDVAVAEVNVAEHQLLIGTQEYNRHRAEHNQKVADLKKSEEEIKEKLVESVVVPAHEVTVEIDHEIGRGSQGSVSKGHLRTEVAIKETIKLESDDRVRVGEGTMHIEPYLGKTLDHPNLVKCLGAREDADRIFMYFEHCDQNSWVNLRRFLYQSGPLSLDAGKKIIKQLIDVVTYLHQKNVAHLDIKPENILVNPHTWQIKLIDFGWAAMRVEAGVLADVEPGTDAYAPPEHLRDIHALLDPQLVDVWAVGSTIFEIMECNMPFANVLGSDPPRFNRLNSIPEMKTLVQKMLRRNTASRRRMSSLVRSVEGW